MFNIFTKNKSISRELRKCRICGKDENNIKFSLGEDGVCGQCKYYSICKICNKEKHYSHMLESGVCKDCQKAQNKDTEVKTRETKRLENVYKLCPFCGEQIKYLAIKCRFCNEMLNKEEKKPAEKENIKSDTKQKIQESIIKSKNKWFAGYIVSGLIWTFAESFRKSTIDECIALIIAITAGIFYHRIKSKIRIKDEVARIIVTFLLIEIVASFLIGFSTGIADRSQNMNFNKCIEACCLEYRCKNPVNTGRIDWTITAGTCKEKYCMRYNNECKNICTKNR